MNAPEPDLPPTERSPVEPWWESSAAQLPAVLARLHDDSHDEVDLFWPLFDYYNHLISKGADFGVQTAILGEAVARFFRVRAYPFFEAMFLELVARSALSAGDLTKGLAAFEEMARIHREDQRGELVELAGDVWGYAKTGLFGSDLQPLIFASVARVFRNIGDLERLAGAYLQASALYAQHGAHDSAASALAEAREIAVASDLPHILTQSHEQEAVLAFERGDAGASVASAKTALALHNAQGSDPTLRLRHNLATAQMELGHLEEAADIYLSLIDIAEDADFKGVLHVNLASCLRRQRALPQASASIGRARDQFDKDTTYDILLELEIVSASIAIDSGDQFETGARLRDAAAMLDRGLQSVLRLHHRQGLREHYIRQLEGRLSQVASQGLASDITPVIAVIYGSVIADWLALLDWVGSLRSSDRLSEPDLQELRERIAAVRTFGAPFSLSSDEQSDNPWDSNLTGKPWDELGETISRLVGQGVASPFEGVSMQATRLLLEARLAEGWCVILPTFANEPVSLWVLRAGAYKRHGLPARSLSVWQVARKHFTNGTAPKSIFTETLNGFTDEVGALLAKDFDALPSTCPGILSLQDYANTIPITSAVLRHDGLRARMAAGEFEVRIVPALYPEHGTMPISHPRMVALVDSSDNLALARVEAEAAATILEAEAFVAVEVDDAARLTEQMICADMLVVSTHGTPISRYSDPFLGSLGGVGRHAITVQALQTDFGALPYRLAMLNACYAGATSFGADRARRTHDAAGYPALLLLNRRAVVSAASWPIGDMISFLYLMLTAQGLKDGLPAPRALCRATARLYDLKTINARALLSTASPPGGRDGTIALLDRAPPTGAFADLYKVGGIEVYTLF
ncbi:hypothetical protein [Novosphingobium sp.]|uniref:hypothetical protein n=1 Tax=Novosphingobium sp. TaxID=1874826 RepID=UPI0031D91AED